MVEDDSALREFIVGLVTRIGYIADEAANGQEAIARLPRYSYDLILCALRMPTMNGPAFYCEIQSRYPGAGLQIIFMTAHAELHEYPRFLTAVGAPVLRKPFSIRRTSSCDRQPGPYVLTIIGTSTSRGRKSGITLALGVP